ncbi:hypothetical protein [Burkholderia ambifaria]|uniref:hypothetical protein n=1 Tax=Burkholderia ambifaria TaxID=152480 RepID=UPI000A751CFA|nr:hypothetical protein [Burkholderia ambifaria]
MEKQEKRSVQRLAQVFHVNRPEMAAHRTSLPSSMTARHPRGKQKNIEAKRLCRIRCFASFSKTSIQMMASKFFVPRIHDHESIRIHQIKSRQSSEISHSH